MRVSERHKKSRPLQDLPHCDTPRADTALPLFPIWRKAPFVLALVFGVAALGGRGLAEPPDDRSYQAARGAADVGEASAFRDKPDTPLGDYLYDWGGPMMQLSFSFVAGFSIGYALAFFLKLTSLLGGGLLLTLFGLQYVGLIDVNWLSLQAYYDAFMTWLQPHTGSFREFVIRNIPAASMAALGLLLGLKKR